MKNLFLLLVLALFTTISCKTPADGSASNAKKKSAKILGKKMLENQVDFEWFSCKTKIKYQDMRRAQSATAAIRMRKDSLIWVQVTALLGIEAARIYMTPDSIHVLNRLDRSYLTSDFNYIEREFQLPMSFDMIQQIIVGNALFYDPETAKSHVKNDKHVLTCFDDDMRRAFWLEKGTYQLRSMVLEDMIDKQKIVADFDKYKKIDNDYDFAYFRNIQVQSQQTGNVNLELNFTKLDINVEKKFLFDVPDRYKRIQY